MLILALDSSAASGSAALVRDGRLLSECYADTGLTHSRTLMQLVDQSMRNAGFKPSDLDLVAVTTGPGSFTGVRIGTATAKGLAQPLDIPCYGVSTLEAIAHPLCGFECTAVSVMDARREQVYCALFRCGNGKNQRLSGDTAISLCELKKILADYEGVKILIGDGADIAYDSLKNEIKSLLLPPPQIKYQRASSAALIAEHKIMNEEESPVSPSLLRPVYLRPPQAERELKVRQSGLT